jgi:hypothetical protein
MRNEKDSEGISREISKYLTRQDFFKKVVENAPDLTKSVSSLRSAISSPQEELESAGKLNIQPEKFSELLSQQSFMVVESWFKRRVS